MCWDRSQKKKEVEKAMKSIIAKIWFLDMKGMSMIEESVKA